MFAVRIAQVLVVLIAIVATIVLLRTFAVESPPAVVPCDKDKAHFITMNEQIIQRLSDAITFQTVSSDEGISEESTLKLHKFLFKSFPIIHNSSLVTKEVVNNYSLLYKIDGTNSELLPYLLAAHMDVVPADASQWDVPPFEGRVQDGFIYGRGTIDDKHSVLSIMEATEALLKSGFRPRRTFYLAFGADEEIQGTSGALKIGQLLESRGVQLSFVLDEGTVITKGIVKMVDNLVALVGVVEKGYATLKLKVSGTAGHSSMPPFNTAIGILAKAITRLEDNPQPNLFGYGVEKMMLETLASYAPFPFKMAFSNLWLFSPIVALVMSRDPVLNGVVRTTTAVTIIQGGIKSNVIPAVATAVVNHRIHPSQTVYQVIEHDKSVINDDRVSIELVETIEPSHISPHSDSTFGFQVVKTSTLEIFPEAVVVPAVMIGATDCKWYLHLTKDVYRFSPVILTPNDTTRYHGNNERIAVDNYEQVINFFHHVILNADKSIDDLAPKRKVEL